MYEDNQLIFLKGILRRLLDDYLGFTAIDYVMHKSDFHTFPLDYIPRKYKINTDEIHDELFYNQEIHYNLMQMLSDNISEHNNRIDTFISLFKSMPYQKKPYWFV